jgi:hypothetical protein
MKPANPLRLYSFLKFPLRAALVGFSLLSSAHGAERPQGLVVEPKQVELAGNFARAQLVASVAGPTFTSSDRKVVRVDSQGALYAVGNGTAEIVVTLKSSGAVSSRAVSSGAVPSIRVPVTVKDVVPLPSVSYSRDVVPIISKAGCNMGACHASQYGKAGFKLSVFGYEPTQDFAAIVRDRSERRVNFLEPEQSLLLKKPTLQVPHGGGRRMKIGSTEYQTLVAWIASGAPGPNPSDPPVTRIVAGPARKTSVPGAKQQLRVEAFYSDGTSRDVTALAKFDSMDEGVLSVTREGLVTINGKGQAPALVRYEGQAATCLFMVPYAAHVELSGWKNQNFVDELAAARFRELGIEPSALCSDAAFLRRAYFDAIGTQPNVGRSAGLLVVEGSSQADEAGRQPAGSHGRFAARRAQRRVRRLVDAQMV